MTEDTESPAKGERIAKRIARAGICSRRDAERLIALGKVSLNGKVLDSPAVVVTDADRIVVDGAGIGSSIVANKVRGIRAAKCDSMDDVVNSRKHNDANVLALGARLDRALARTLESVRHG